jgi:hypothetical protein
VLDALEADGENLRSLDEEAKILLEKEAIVNGSKE